MAEPLFTFNSEWPVVQVAMVVDNPMHTTEKFEGTWRRFKHNLGYPPLAIGLAGTRDGNIYNSMILLDVDETYVYINTGDVYARDVECAVVHPVDITYEQEYRQYSSRLVKAEKEEPQIDLRKFLLHSRASTPMVLAVKPATFGGGNTRFAYTHNLPYETFMFGWLRSKITSGLIRKGVWRAVPLNSTASPFFESNGRTGILSDSSGVFDRCSIMVLRNPYLMLDNTVEITV